MIGIYRFYFEANGQTYSYVGSSTNIQQRWRQHIDGLKTSYNKYYEGGVGAKGIRYQLFDASETDELNTMYDKVMFVLALNDISTDKVKFEVIQQVESGNLEDIELEYIIKYKSEIFGFNDFNWRLRSKRASSINEFVQFYIMNQSKGVVVPWVLCDDRLDGCPNVDPSNKNNVSIEIADAINKYSHWTNEKKSFESITIEETDKFIEFEKVRNERITNEEVKVEKINNKPNFNKHQSKSGRFVKTKTIKSKGNISKYERDVNKYIDKGWEILSTNSSETIIGWRE